VFHLARIRSGRVAVFVVVVVVAVIRFRYRVSEKIARTHEMMCC